MEEGRVSDLVVRATLDARDYQRGLTQMRDQARMSLGVVGREADRVGAQLDGLSSPFRKFASGVTGLISPFLSLAAIGTTVIGVMKGITEWMQAEETSARAAAKATGDLGVQLERQRGNILTANNPLARDIFEAELQKTANKDALKRLFEEGQLSTGGAGDRLRAKINDVYTMSVEQAHQREMTRQTEQRAAAEKAVEGVVTRAIRASISERDRALREYADDVEQIYALIESMPDAEKSRGDALLAQRREARDEILRQIDERAAKERSLHEQLMGMERARIAYAREEQQFSKKALEIELLRARGKDEDAEKAQIMLAIEERIAETRRADGLSEAQRAERIGMYRELEAAQLANVKAEVRGPETRGVAAGTSAALIERVLGPQGGAATAATQQLRVVEIIRQEVSRVAPLLTRIESSLNNGVAAVAG